MRRPRVAPLPTIPDLHLTADRALSLHRPTRWQAQGQLCACRSLSLSLLPEVTSLDLHATEIAADRAVHPSAGSERALHRLAGSRPQLCVSPTALCPSRPDPALNLATTRPTVCVSRWWAGRDSLREQKKPEARKMLENAAESHQSAARFVRWRSRCQSVFLTFIT